MLTVLKPEPNWEKTEKQILMNNKFMQFLTCKVLYYCCHFLCILICQFFCIWVADYNFLKFVKNISINKALKRN